ncbi:pentatricopeptide repeat-containing protein At1g80270, mitochondrial-like [Primulina tabacum]|uniref:pentatricopeptide repeat-containing protein At1g80270, mitochondrial-like n=1 Tax=Primulina tabacum TaxID=48773 RepID=UPI003F59DE32
MWALRRASVYLRHPGLSSGSTRISCVQSKILTCCLENYHAGLIGPQENLFDEVLSTTRFYYTSSVSLKSCTEVHPFSSQAGPNSHVEDDDDKLEDGFSDLETPCGLVQESTSGDENSDMLFEGDGFTDDEENELEASITEADAGKKRSPETKPTSTLTNTILAALAVSMKEVCEKWVEEGNEITQTEVSLTMLELRKRRMFLKALQLSEWSEKSKRLYFLENNYASRVDLLAKVRGLLQAERYVKQIPESFRGELVYRTLLANCVAATDAKKSEEVFAKIKNLGLPVSLFSCNQMLLLYKRSGNEKIADVLLFMQKENIKPSVFTYQILIDIKGKSNDISGMEQILETMKAEGVKPNNHMLVSLARYYTAVGLKDKADTMLKEVEGDDINENLGICRVLLPIYASLGREDEVGRIWKACESRPGWEDCMAAIEAWGQLRKIENAEAAFDIMVKKLKKKSVKHFTALLKVYANNEMFAKAKNLVKQMEASGCSPDSLTWDALVTLYIGTGEVEKADNILEKAAQQRRGRPLFNSYTAIMDQYAKRGDTHNAERLFLRMRKAGYTARLRQYNTLLLAYKNAKAPVYGFIERMKGDGLSPSKSFTMQVAKVDAFRKPNVADLLEL